MGASAREFMDIRIESQHYNDIPNHVRESMEIKTVDVKGVDYSEDELWVRLKSDSDKAYRKLKKREFELRHSK